MQSREQFLSEYKQEIRYQFWIIGLVVAAHAAALGYCINALNSYGPTQTRGIGLLILFFGGGFMAGGVNMAALYFSRMVVVNAIRDGRDPSEEISKEFLTKTGFYSLLISGAALVFGVLVFIARYVFY